MDECRWRDKSVRVVEQVGEDLEFQIEVQSHRDPPAVRDVRRHEEYVGPLFNEVRPEVRHAGGPQLGEVDGMVAVHPHRGKAALVTNEKRRRAVTFTLVHFGQ